MDRNGTARAQHAARPMKASDAPRVGRSDVRNWLSWAEARVAGEYPPFAAQAAAMLHYTGEKVTVGAVRARLRATGRDAKTLGLSEVAA